MTPAVNDAASAILCDGDAIGAIRYNTGTAAFEGCNGVAWADIRNGATVTAAGTTTQVQFNSGGAFGASANFNWDIANNRLGIGTAAPSVSLAFGTTDAVLLPAGTTAQEPAGVNGMIRYNSTNAKFEGYQAGAWQDILTGAASATPLSGLTVATQANTINNAAWAQNWQWNALAGGNGLALATNGTAALTGQTLLNISASGANATGAQTTYGESISNTHTGTSTNVGLYATASGGTANYAAIFAAGNVGIGNTAPAALLDVGSVGATLGTLRLESSTAASYVQFQPSTTSGAATYTLPPGAPGVTGYVLSSDTSGVMSWISASGGVTKIDDLSDARYDITTDHNMILGQKVNLAAGAQYNLFIGEGAGATAAHSTAATVKNTAVGYQALQALTTGDTNTAVGYQALALNAGGGSNVAVGQSALASNISGNYNVAVGPSALSANTSSGNTAVGSGVLWQNTSGQFNTASGDGAMNANLTGADNTVSGMGVLSNNTSGYANTAIGRYALRTNVTKGQSTAVGFYAMYNADSAAGGAITYNTAVGAYALQGSGTAANNTGVGNTALGHSALIANTSGGNNVALGYNAGSNLTTGSSNIAIGSGVTFGSAVASNQLNIGNLIYGDTSTKKVGINDATLLAGFDLGFSGQAARTVGMERETTAATAGFGLAINAGGAVSGGTDKAGGDLTLSGGTATGTADSKIIFKGSFPQAATNTTDNAPAEVGRITGGGYMNFAGTQGSGDTMLAATGTATPGAGTRMVWYPRQAAFRAGYVSGAHWNDANIGIESVAMGYNAIASGTASTAFGEITTASGTASTAMGTGNTASGNGSTAIGENDTASGTDSTAMGNFSTASGTDSTAMGYVTTASGNNSTAMGSYAMAGDGSATHTIGANSMAIGLTSTATATKAKVTGTGSLGIFMQDQHNVVMDANNAMALLGGKMIINPATALGAGMVSTPDTALDVRGSIKVGDGAETCGATYAGAIRYNTSAMQFCNGTAWANIASGGGGGSIDGLSDAIADRTTGHNLLMGNLDAGYAIVPATGQYNVAVGELALTATTTGTNNTALGYQALNANVAKQESTALGYEAMQYADSTATAAITYNTAVGAYAMQGSTTASANTGISNTAIGYQALRALTSGNGNTAVGFLALIANNTGRNNVAAGSSALWGNTTGIRNTAVGVAALNSNAAKQESTALGYNAMAYADDTGTGSVTYNTAVGAYALLGSATAANNTGTANTALGHSALFSNTTGSQNIASGYIALYSNTTGSSNAAYGMQSLKNNTTGSWNTAMGLNALYSNTTGSNNTATGLSALQSNVAKNESTAMGYMAMQHADSTATASVTYNTAVGAYALQGSTFGANSGTSNTALGHSALIANNSGSHNVAIGAGTSTTTAALASNTSSSDSTAVGYTALASSTGASNTALGSGAGYAGTANTTGSNNTFLGYQAQANGAAYTNATAIGNGAIVTGSNYIQLGNSAVTQVYFGTGAGTPVLTAGMYVTASDRRLKKDIMDSDLGLDFIEKLRPVSYRFKQGNNSLRYGFIAQDVEKALAGHPTGIVMRQDDEMKTYELNYSEIISPLVKAVQQQQQEITTEKSSSADKDARQQHENAVLKQQISLLTSEIADLKKDIADLKAAHAR